MLALSTGLEALLSQEGEAGASGRVTLPDAVVQGVGGFARTTAKALEATLASANSRVTIPKSLEGVFLTAMLPIGLGQGLQRLVILLTLGALRTMRSGAELARGLLHSGWLPSRTPGRVRPPRLLGRLQLVYPCRDSSSAALVQAACVVTRHLGLAAEVICCVECVDPVGSYVLATPTTLLCFLHGTPAVQWEFKLADLLIIQQQGQRLRLLWLLPQSPSQASAGGGATYVHTQELELSTGSAAEDTYEILRTACLNVRSSPMPPSAPCPMLRSVLLLPETQATQAQKEMTWAAEPRTGMPTA